MFYSRKALFRLLSLTFLLVGFVCADTAWAAHFDVSNGQIVLNDKSTQSPAIITGTSTGGSDNNGTRVAVWIKNGFNGGTVILDNLSINLSSTTGSIVGPIHVGGINSLPNRDRDIEVTFFLSGDNKLWAQNRSGRAGIQVSGANVTLNFDNAPGTLGYLTVRGGSSIHGGAAGIGSGGGFHQNGGIINIKAGTITAQGGNGDFRISRYTVVNSGVGRVGGSGRVIGFGRGSGGGAGIGGGRTGNINGGSWTVTIYNGAVTAIGGFGGAAFGGGGSGVGRGGDSGTFGIRIYDFFSTGGFGAANGISNVTITGGSVQPKSRTFPFLDINNPKNGNGTALSSKNKTYNTSDYGKTLTFLVEDSDRLPYLYSFTVPQDGNANLWLPSGATIPTDTLNTDHPWLSNLALSKGTLSPRFSPVSQDYTAIVPNDVEGLMLTPTAYTNDLSRAAIITVNGDIVSSNTPSGPISLNVGNNHIPVVIASGDAKTTYSITVKRSSAPELSP